MDAIEALRKLDEGNQRFIANIRGADAFTTQINRAGLVDNHKPFAVILGCADARTPAELIFDQGLGDLFVIRVAGNIVAPSQIGSVEFAVERLGLELVVVMGHTRCGAVGATLDVIRAGTPMNSKNLMSIVERIRPAVTPVVELGGGGNPEVMMRTAVRANVRASANQLRHGSPLLEKVITDGKLLVVGAEYDLMTGMVDFFDGAPALSPR